MVHVPHGCSVWPSAWVTSSDWPTGGEIDIYEAVNLQTTNQVSPPVCLGSNTKRLTRFGTA